MACVVNMCGYETQKKITSFSSVSFLSKTHSQSLTGLLGIRDWLETFCAERVTTRRIGQCDDNRHRGNITIKNRVGRQSGKNSAEVKRCICYVCVAGKRPARWPQKMRTPVLCIPSNTARERNTNTLGQGVLTVVPLWTRLFGIFWEMPSYVQIYQQLQQQK
jgi:hypothetical protein